MTIATATTTTVAERLSVRAGSAPAGVLPSPRGPRAQEALDPSIEAAWLRFKETGCRASRERLIVHYAPMVQQVAGRMGMRLPSSVELGDLISYGTFGLIDAIDKYELGRDVKFEAYAAQRVRGAILDELRSLDWVPRSVRSRARALETATGDLHTRLQRTPTTAELAEEMGVAESDVHATRAQVHTSHFSALDDLVGGSDDAAGASLGDVLADAQAVDPAAAVDDAETSFLLARALEQLSERERLVVVLSFYEGRTHAQIGAMLGVTESRVSQMRAAALKTLRRAMLLAEAA